MKQNEYKKALDQLNYSLRETGNEKDFSAIRKLSKVLELLELHEEILKELNIELEWDCEDSEMRTGPCGYSYIIHGYENELIPTMLEKLDELSKV